MRPSVEFPLKVVLSDWLSFQHDETTPYTHSTGWPVARYGFRSSKMCLHWAVVKTAGTWSSRKYLGSKQAFDECCCKYAGIAGVAFCIMGPWNLAGGTHIFRFCYCFCLQVRRYSEDGGSMFRRSAGPQGVVTRKGAGWNFIARRASQLEQAFWDCLCRRFWLNTATKWTYDVHNSSISRYWYSTCCRK